MCPSSMLATQLVPVVVLIAPPSHRQYTQHHHHKYTELVLFTSLVFFRSRETNCALVVGDVARSSRR